MIETHHLCKNSARTAGVLTLSGLMIGGIALAQGTSAAPEIHPVSQVSKTATLQSLDQDLSHVPADLSRPAVAPKTHEQLQQEKAQQEAEARAAAERAEAERAEAGRVQAERRAAEEAAAAEAVAAQSEQRTVSETAPAAGPQAAPGVKAAPAPQTAAPVWKPSSTDSTPQPIGPSEGSAKGSAIARAAQDQIGNAQDCTMLVSNALRAVGINFHGWPKDYLQLGHTVSASEAQPGDLIYYASNGMGQSHVAVYLGKGKAVHGGWNGGTTVSFSAHLPTASSPVFIRVDR